MNKLDPHHAKLLKLLIEGNVGWLRAVDHKSVDPDKGLVQGVTLRALERRGYVGLANANKQWPAKGQQLVATHATDQGEAAYREYIDGAE